MNIIHEHFQSKMIHQRYLISNLNIHHIFLEIQNPKLPLTFANQRPRCKNISHPFHRLKASFTKHRCLVSTETPIWRKSNIYIYILYSICTCIWLYHIISFFMPLYSIIYIYIDMYIIIFKSQMKGRIISVLVVHSHAEPLPSTSFNVLNSVLFHLKDFPWWFL